MTPNDLMLGFQSFLGMLGICIQWHIIICNVFYSTFTNFFYSCHVFTFLFLFELFLHLRS